MGGSDMTLEVKKCILCTGESSETTFQLLRWMIKIAFACPGHAGTLRHMQIVVLSCQVHFYLYIYRYILTLVGGWVSCPGDVVANEVTKAMPQWHWAECKFKEMNRR